MGWHWAWSSETQRRDWELIVAEFVRVLRRTVDTIDETADQHGWGPARNSLARREHDLPRWNLPDVENPHVGLWSHVGFVLVALNDHLTTLGRIMGAEPTLLGTYPMARVATEAAARLGWWCEPIGHEDERVGRHLVTRVESLRSQAKTIRSMESDEHWQAELERHADIVQYAARFGFEVETSPSGTVLHVVGAENPDAITLVQRMASTEPRRVAETFNRFLSGTVHTDPGRLRDWMASTPADFDGVSGSTITMEISTGMLSVVTATVFDTTINAVDRLIDYYGWSSKRWEQAKQTSYVQLRRRL